MAKRRYTAEEIVTALRQVEVAVANGKPTPQRATRAVSPSRPTIAGAKSTAGSS